MNSAEAARRFLAQLRLQEQAFDGTAVIDEALVRRGAEWYLRQAMTPDEFNNDNFHTLADEWISNGVDTVDNFWDTHFAPVMQQIEGAANTLFAGLGLEENRPIIGHMATGNLNAVTMPVPGDPGSYLVVMEDEVISFAAFTCTVIAGTVPHGPAEQDKITLTLGASKVEERIAANSKLVDRFTELVLRYAVIGNLRGVQLPTLSPGRLRLSEMLITAVDHFVVGHEYAHVLMGHLDDADVRKGLPPIPDVESVVYSWMQEADADLLGASLAMVAVKQHDYATGLAGICIFFGMLDVMERAVSLLQTGAEDSRQLGTHPPASIRKQFLYEGLPRLTGGDPRVAEQLKTALEVADSFAEIIDLLWDRIKPIVVGLHAQGVSAAHKWRTIPKKVEPERDGSVSLRG
ncbi:hypothetical protein [Nocardia sp. XZ_19_369]|uniref:hypothetical protein n=1 Tax=Nocardia sp. XZ_19_369 TaxID=2769487 RepID=UPI00188ED522|nr:hypothetical protein [Nocardia sp. XZ_19_369]